MSAEEFRLNLRVLWYYGVTIAALATVFIAGPKMLEAILTFASHIVNSL